MNWAQGTNRGATKLPGPQTQNFSKSPNLFAFSFTEDLKESISTTNTDITRQTSERVRCIVQQRTNLCQQQKGHQLEHLLR